MDEGLLKSLCDLVSGLCRHASGASVKCWRRLLAIHPFQGEKPFALRRKSSQTRLQALRKNLSWHMFRAACLESSDAARGAV
jgi:hypothetical protein